MLQAYVQGRMAMNIYIYVCVYMHTCMHTHTEAAYILMYMYLEYMCVQCNLLMNLFYSLMCYQQDYQMRVQVLEVGIGCDSRR